MALKIHESGRHNKNGNDGLEFGSRLPMASNTQIDRLGDRLRTGDFSDEDLRALDEYRLSFSDAYEFVIG
ncbi:MAG TPA: hypothetical protein VHQ64_05225, partial [Pyrinomonadaceae bacterium]|nr:hypothetical protein [Pyrinomonadaceae bacterium]